MCVILQEHEHHKELPFNNHILHTKQTYKILYEYEVTWWHIYALKSYLSTRSQKENTLHWAVITTKIPLCY